MNVARVPPIPPDRPRRPPDYEPPQPPQRPRWPRVLRWMGMGVLVLIVLVVVGVTVLLKSSRAHRYVLNVAEKKATATVGAQVSVESFALGFSGISPTLDLYNVTVAGAPPYATPPLLRVDHIGVGVHVTSLLHRQWYFSSLRVDHPVVRMFVDRRGTDNLPKSKSSGGQSHTSVFDLGVRHARLDHGEVYYNDRKSVLTADLHNLQFQSAFNTADRSYAGTLSYSQGRLQTGNFNSIAHDLQASFIASPAQFTLQRAVLSSGRSQFVLTATLSDYAQPRLQANYTALLDSGELGRIIKNSSLPAGDIRLAGTLQYQSRPSQPALQDGGRAGQLEQLLVAGAQQQFSRRRARSESRLPSGQRQPWRH